MDAGPLRITEQNTADNANIDALYFENQMFW